MRLRVDVDVLRRSTKLLSTFGSGRGYFNQKASYGRFDAHKGGLRLTLTTPIGAIAMELDAEVKEAGCVGMDLAAFSEYLKHYPAGTHVDLSTGFCERTEERAILLGVFGTARNASTTRQEWVIQTRSRGGLLFDEEWVPDPPQQAGELLQGVISLSRLKELVLPALSGYREDLREMGAMTNGAALVLGSDQLSVYAASSEGGVQASAWADAGVELGLQWDHPTQTVWVHGESLRRAVAALGAINGLSSVVLTVPVAEDQPVRLAAAEDPEGFWVLLPRAVVQGMDLPELITEAARSGEKAVAKLPTHSGMSSWPLMSALESLKAYQTHDVGAGQRSSSAALLELTKESLVVEVLSDLQVGGTFTWPWSAEPTGRLLRGKRPPLVAVSMSLLLGYLGAVLQPIARDLQADVELVLSIDEDGQERLLLRSESELGVRVTALVCTMSTTGRRLADGFIAAEAERELVGAA